ncbi:cytochrome c [uncultured Roseobacter sp.]|uniref:c-type cytochrome n=1 Tax=uncultured Roseobacter sp. TaxID=114847 RepID=UPI00263A29BB|nr:cytochrome c [uncultured Roseobacter sp.]
MNRRTVLATSGLALAGLVAATFMLGPTQADGLLVPDNPQIVARGAEVYAQECASCHGANLGGQPGWRVRGEDGMLPAPPHDASGHTWHHDDETLFILTKYGLSELMENAPPSGMPAYDGVLSDEDIVAVLSYIKSTWPDGIRAHHDALNAQSDP